MFIITKFDVQLNCPFSTPIPEEIQITESKNWNSTPIHKAIYANSSVDVADLLKISTNELVNAVNVEKKMRRRICY